MLRLGYEGGFMTADAVFAQNPSLVITGDGLVLVPGAVPAIYPGPMVMPAYSSMPVWVVGRASRKS